MQHEWVMLANLFLLLMGFALLSRHFEKSRVPDEMPAFLPDDWKGGFALLVDHLRALELPRQHRCGADRRHDGAPRVSGARSTSAISPRIVAASNAGGAGSVVGDTTTTMMWIDGISPLGVLGGLCRGRCRAC